MLSRMLYFLNTWNFIKFFSAVKDGTGKIIVYLYFN